MGAELFYADEQTDRHDEPNSLFLNFANAPKERPLNPLIVIHKIYYLKGLISYENSTWGCVPREGLYQLIVFTVFLSHSINILLRKIDVKTASSNVPLNVSFTSYLYHSMLCNLSYSC